MVGSADKEKLANTQITVFRVVNLDGVTSATDGTKKNVSLFRDKSVDVIVSGNTGAVTVNIESSNTGLFAGEEISLDTETFTAENKTRIYPYSSYFKFIRVTTDTHANATVTAIISGRS